jgi:uncharacterized membrane protein
MKHKLGVIWSHFIRNFGQGLLFVVPIATTLFVLYYIFEWLDTLIPIEIPGLGVLIIIVGVSLVGIIGSTLVKTPLFNWFNRFLSKAPIVKIIYSSVKDLLSAFVGNKKKFTKPVLVKITPETSQIGFLTQDSLTDLGLSDELVSVYIPFSFSIMGNVYIVPKKNITELEASPTETMKFVVSGGVTNVNDQRKEKELEDSK